MCPQPIYLDNQATTQIDPRVADVMRPYLTEQYGNAHSAGHAFGWRASDAVERSRQEVAALLGCDAREVIFTSGATESCNLAIRGLCRAAKSGAAQQSTARRKIVTTATEHPCVLETCMEMGAEGFEIVVLGVQPDGLVDLAQLEETVDQRTLLVTVMAANNEIGVLQPISAMAKICSASGACLHTDAAQATGKIPVNVTDQGVDLSSMSGHKLYGPMGVGALYVKWNLAMKPQPIMTGGGQEHGLRPGTLPVPLIVGLGEACRLAGISLEREMGQIEHLTTQLRDGLLQMCPRAILHGHPEKRVPGNINISFPGFSGDEIVETVCDRLAISTGSACASTKTEPSHVLLALGIGPEATASAIRLSVGRFNTQTDIERAVGVLSAIVGTNTDHRIAHAS